MYAQCFLAKDISNRLYMFSSLTIRSLIDFSKLLEVLMMVYSLVV